MPVAVGARKQRAMTRRGLSIGVVVVAVGKERAVLHQQAESTLAEPIVISGQVVAAELVNDDHYNQPGTSVVGGSDCNNTENQGAEETSKELADGQCHRA